MQSKQNNKWINILTIILLPPFLKILNTIKIIFIYGK